MDKKNSKMLSVDRSVEKSRLMHEKLKISDICEITGLTRSAILNSISKGRLRADYVNDVYYLSMADYKNYRATLYSREFSKVNGKPLYDTANGEFSLAQAAEYCKMKYSQFYYYMSRGLVKYSRKRKSWVFRKEHLDEFLIDVADYKACSRKGKIERFIKFALKRG